MGPISRVRYPAHISPSQAGIYKANVTLEGCTKASNTLTLTKNVRPIANAGPDQVIVLPERSVTLNGSGSDADGTITSYQWSQVSGPSVTLNGASTSALSLNDLPVGTYVFKLIVADNFPEGSAPDQVTVTVNAPPNNYNRITETLVFVPDKKNETDLDPLQVQTGQKSVTIQYFDGLGNPMQRVNKQGSPLAKDMVSPVVYDAVGRSNLNYLPVTVNQTNGYYKVQADIIDAATKNYKGIAANFHDDARPFAETSFESSPLNRPVKTYGAGVDWKDEDKAVSHQYLVNTHGTGSNLTSEKIIAWRITAGLPVRAQPVTGFIETNGYYSNGQLLIKVTVDEDGHQVREYTDKAGRIVLKKVQAVSNPTSLNHNLQWALTYYVYDDFGDLRFVLQPVMGGTILGSNTYNPSQPDLDKLAFQYKYDSRHRMIEKKVPGAEPVYMVYDKLNRLVLTQDGN